MKLAQKRKLEEFLVVGLEASERRACHVSTESD